MAVSLSQQSVDIIPTIQEIQQFSQPRRVGETESGERALNTGGSP
jgi:hypothetical protein